MRVDHPLDASVDELELSVRAHKGFSMEHWVIQRFQLWLILFHNPRPISLGGQDVGRTQYEKLREFLHDAECILECRFLFT
jgi:hypothetical protein